MVTQFDGARKYPQSKVLLSSHGRGWLTLAAEVRSHPAGPVVPAIQSITEIVIRLDRPLGDAVHRESGDGQTRENKPVGPVSLIPAGVEAGRITITPPIAEILHLYIPAERFALLAKQYGFAKSPADFVRHLGGLKDDLIFQIGCAVCSELRNETATGLMFAESASLMLATQLVHRYCDGAFLKGGSPSALRLDRSRLQRVLDYIEQHLEDDITVAVLARQANLSIFHFTRTFTATLGIAPFRYVSKRRLKHAMTLLAETTQSLGEIAHRCRFSSQTNFSRAFRRATGMTPNEYRRLVRGSVNQW